MSAPQEDRRQPPELPAVVNAIREGYAPERIILFGSFAWGHPTPDSDVDLLIIKETDDPPLERCYKVRRMVQRARRGLPMDILVLTEWREDAPSL